MGCHVLLQCIKVKSESEVAQTCPTLRVPMDCSPPGSSVHGIFQARVLEWGAIAFSTKDLMIWISIPIRDQIVGSLKHLQKQEICRNKQTIATAANMANCGNSYLAQTLLKSVNTCSNWTQVKVVQSCPTLCNPVDYNLPGNSVHGILQARILEWVVIPFSRGSSQPRDQTLVSCIAGRFFTIWATREEVNSRPPTITAITYIQTSKSPMGCNNVSYDSTILS